MSDELVKKALNHYVTSYPGAEGRTYEQIVIVTDIAKVIRDEIERPKDEKDALMAAMLLIASRDVEVAKKAPADLESYGKHVQAIVQDYVANPEKEYTSSADLKQIGLANAIVLMPIMAETMKDLNNGLDHLRGSPEVAKAIDEMKGALEQSRTELESLMTGDQPRLEARARAAYANLLETSKEAVKIYETPPKEPQQPVVAKPKKRRFGF